MQDSTHLYLVLQLAHGLFACMVLCLYVRVHNVCLCVYVLVCVCTCMFVCIMCAVMRLPVYMCVSVRASVQEVVMRDFVHVHALGVCARLCVCVYLCVRGCGSGCGCGCGCNYGCACVS